MSSQTNSSATEEFEQSVARNITSLRRDNALMAKTHAWMLDTLPHRYSYNFRWMDRPIIQYPQDMVAVQELIWKIKPDLVIETGIAHGGSLILSASMLALLDYCEAVEAGVPLDPKVTKRRVLGIDIDIRAHNRAAIEAHPMASRIAMVQGSAVAPEVVQQVRDFARGYRRVLVCLDSMHTHDHVLGELDAYAPLVSPGSYCVVFDTFVEDMPPKFFADRPWDVGNNPKTAVRQWLAAHAEFEVDTEMERRLQVTVAPHGFLRRKGE